MICLRTRTTTATETIRKVPMKIPTYSNDNSTHGQISILSIHWATYRCLIRIRFVLFFGSSSLPFFNFFTIDCPSSRSFHRDNSTLDADFGIMFRNIVSLTLTQVTLSEINTFSVLAVPHLEVSCLWFIESLVYVRQISENHGFPQTRSANDNGLLFSRRYVPGGEFWLKMNARDCNNIRFQGEPTERTGLLIDQQRRNIVSSPQIRRISEDDMPEYPSSLPKRDEQTALNSIVQQTNS